MKVNFKKSFLTSTALVAALFFMALGFLPGSSAEAAKSFNWIGPAGEPSTPPDGWESSVPLIAGADVAAGKAKTQQACMMCHTLDNDGGTKIGPNLYGIVNRPHAHVDGFSYTDALKDMKMRPWSYEELDSFLYDPKAHAPGTRMPYAGDKDTRDRANVIAYLRTLADKPAPLPKTK